MTPEQTLDWLAQQHFAQCREDRPVQHWIRKMKSELPPQPEQEPVAMWDGYHQFEFGNLSAYKLEKSSWIPLYTTLPMPEQEPWQGLTKEEIDSALSKYASWYEFAAHLENILKEKNQ